MGLLLRQLFQMLRLLNSETGSVQLAAGITCGFVLGMTPVFSLQTVLIFLVIFFFRVQMGAALASAFFFKFVAFALDPAFHLVGEWALSFAALEGFYTALYNLPLIPYTRFYNTVVMGSGVLSLALSRVVFVVSLHLVKKYQKVVVARFQQTRAWKLLQASTLYRWYHKYSEYYG